MTDHELTDHELADHELAIYAMPSLGADMDDGTMIEWLVDIGDTFERGQVIARVETEKSDIDIEIWHDGVVAEIVVHANETVDVGTTLMRFRTSGGPAAAGTPPVPESAGAAEPAQALVTAAPTSPIVSTIATTQRATPLARRYAADRGFELDGVVGSGPDGAVRAVDLPSSVDRSKFGPLEAEPELKPASRSDRMRSMIAARMDRANRDIPHYRLEQSIDLGALLDHVAAMNEQRPIAERIVPAAALIRAVAIAAAAHPELNGTWVDDQFRPGSGVNVSVAISLRQGGLVTPTIRAADTRRLDEVMMLLRDFTLGARSGTMRSEWTTIDSSITVTNLGDRGADLVHGLISPPEVALVGFGRIAERPAAVDGAVVVRPMVTATLGADHRATDGAVGSRFLSTLTSALEDPTCL